MANLIRETLQDELEALGQTHVLAQADTLDSQGCERLALQLSNLDLALARTAFQSMDSPPTSVLHPASPVPHPAQGGSASEFAEARDAGEAELRAGRVGVLLVAGGQATRLGRPGPKGMFPIGPVSDRSLFELFAQQLRGLGRRYGQTPVWAVMTSPQNDTETRRFFESKSWFGLDPQDLFFFEQGEAPSFSQDGLLLFEAPDRLLTSPDGHGGVIPALARSGVLRQLADRGVAHLFHHQVDNPLVPLADPVLVGFRVVQDAEMASKVVAKGSPDDRVGTWAQIDGNTSVVEYTEIQEPARSSRDSAGKLRFWAGSINVHVFGRCFLERMALDSGRALPYHASPKPLRALGPDGRKTLIEGFKLERFVFDAVPMATKTVLVEALREEEYAPLKNAEGQDSVATCRAAISARNHRWLREAGVKVPRDVLLEVDVSRYDGPEALRKSGLREVAAGDDAILTSRGGQL